MITTKILHLDASISKNSRTKELANYLISKLDGEVTYLKLANNGFAPLSGDKLIWRDELIAKKDFHDPYFDRAKLFRDSDIVVITAPFYDLSFPSSLKVFFENINVIDLLFTYLPDGSIKSLCVPKKIYYVTTAGGAIHNNEYSFGYIKSLAETFYNTTDCLFISAKNLDVVGQNVNQLLHIAKTEIDKLLKNKN
ncbi:MAG: NAD(P)H-dependent oxidoreductase [Bacilli bacterium]|nr:NAD(P)H-dependent oxidoreductase [Bacilli bacterium]